MRDYASPLVIRSAILSLMISLPLYGARAQSRTHVDLELVLAVDSSASIDVREFELQAVGIARAFRDAEIIDAIERWTPRGVAVTVVQWAHQQQVAVDWVKVFDRASAEALAARIETMRRTMRGETAIGELLRFAIGHIEDGPFHGARRIIDVSGDGQSNYGSRPGLIRDAAAAAGITVNGLVIVHEEPTVDLYYADHVIGGSDAFLMTARDYHDFAHAIRLKLLREISGAPLG